MINIKEYFNLNKDIFIDEIMVDSRTNKHNSIFFCLIGLSVDGHDYIDNAIENGAIAIVHSKDISNKKENITYIKVDDTTSELNKFADYFYGYPSHSMKIYGVTGTNGKTTVSYITYYLLNKLNTKCGYIGTLGYKYNEKMISQYFTTPNINDLHSILKELKDNNCKASAIEISSQGLDLHRTDSVDIDVACFTNLTHDHLDYHKTFENYFNAKAILFHNLKKDGIACINVDDEYGRKMIKECNCKVVTYGIDNEANYKAYDLNLYENYSTFKLKIKNDIYSVKTNLVAKFNISNLLCVIASLVETNYKINDIIPLLENIELVPGRCMNINEGQDFNVIVDFAHTPDGFIKILEYAKAITKKNSRIIVVFGLRGSGDVEKRPVCGNIVDDYCDEIILTSDDNHYEDVNKIISEIEVGIKKHKALKNISREDAIKQGINMCKTGDTLCILGKGVDDFYKESGKIVPYEGDHIIASKILKSISNH